MKKFHIAISVNDIEKSVLDYTDRLGQKPCVVVHEQYALWRTESLNLSIRKVNDKQSGQLRHLGWEDSNASQFTTSTDVNGILWEHFNATQQANEIKEAWPDTDYNA